MIDAKAKHPNCAYMWINWITKPDIQAQVAEYFGEAPGQPEGVRADRPTRTFCTQYHAGDPTFYGQLVYWKTPTAKCLDGRTDVTCKDYAAWTAAWDEIKG